MVLGPLEAPAAPNAPGDHTEVGRSRAPGGAGHRERAGGPPGRDVTEEAGLLLRCPRVADDGHELRGGGEEGTGCDDAAELLDHHAQLDESEPHAPLLVGHRETGPAQLDHVVPERVGG